jgi:hypothetical protein
MLVISLLLQSCDVSPNLPIEGEEEPAETIELEGQGRRKRATIKIETKENGQKDLRGSYKV